MAALGGAGAGGGEKGGEEVSLGRPWSGWEGVGTRTVKQVFTVCSPSTHM